MPTEEKANPIKDNAAFIAWGKTTKAKMLYDKTNL